MASTDEKTETHDLRNELMVAQCRLHLAMQDIRDLMREVNECLERRGDKPKYDIKSE